MWYRNALAIGRSQGTIQCTYAIIYDENGNRLFALQRKNFDEKYKAYQGRYEYSTVFRTIVDTGFGAEGIVAWEFDQPTPDGFTDTGYINFDLPLVFAEKHSSERLVPVKLDYNAVAYIKKTLASAAPVDMVSLITVEEWSKFMSDPTYKPSVYKKITVPEFNTGKANGDLVEYKGVTYHFEFGKDYNPRWKRLTDMLNDTDTFYVKPAAFDWQPVDVSHMNNGSNPEWVLRKKAAKENYDKAKRLLILAAGSNIL